MIPIFFQMQRLHSSPVLIFLIAILGLSCQPTDKTPKVSQTEMEYILTEVHLADAVVDHLGGHLIHRNIRRDDIIDEILSTQDINREDFYDSYQYYLQHPVELDSIYTHILLQLQVLQDSMNNMEKDYFDSQNELKKMMREREKEKATKP